MSTRRMVTLTAAMMLGLGFTGCRAQAPNNQAASSATVSASASATASSSASPSAPSAASAEAMDADLAAAPGPYGGASYDESAALEAIKSSGATDLAGWMKAIVDATHGDYATDYTKLRDMDTSVSSVAGTPTEAGGPQTATVGANHFAIVLDASGSMADNADGQSRMEAAKAAVLSFAERLPADSTLSLRVYGQRGSGSNADKALSCASTEVIYQGSPARVGTALRSLAPHGWTPLARAIKATAGDIPADASDALVYVVTDGLETCGGDPVAAARGLAKSGIKPIVNVIGFQVGNTDQEQLRAIANAGHGRYTDVRTGADLDAYWKADAEAMMKAWSDWQSDALQKISDEGDTKMADADALQNDLLHGLNEEQTRQLHLATVLGNDDMVDYDTESALYSALYERGQALWSYCYELGNQQWSQTYDSQTSNWSQAYKLGSAKWSDYYRKSIGH